MERDLLPPRSLLAGLVAAALLCASASTSAGPLYRWVDDEGKVHYGDAIPPQYVQKGYRVVSEQGITVYTIKPASELPPPEPEEEKEEAPPPLTPFERGLLATYIDSSEIEEAKQKKLADIDTITQLTRENIQLLEQQFHQLTKEAGDFERRGREVPEVLRQDIATIREKITDLEQTIERYKQQRVEAIEEFEALKRRFEALKARQQGTSGKEAR